MSETTSRTILFFLSVTLALVLLSNIPLLYGYLALSPELKFMGIVAGVRDANFYFMMMAQADGWNPILRNYFACGEPDAIYHGFFWFFLGKLGNWLGLSPLVMYHGFRIGATVAFVPASYYVVSRFLRSRAERVVATLMVAFGAGAGWVMMPLRFSGLPFVPVDVGTPEASSFFTLMTFPHLSCALILIGVCAGLLWDSFRGGSLWPALTAGVLGLILGFIHAVNLVVIFAVVGAFVVVSLGLGEKRPMRAALIFGAVSVWSLAYYVYLSLTKPELLPQAPVRSPTPLSYLVGFAPFLVLAAIHVGALVRKRAFPGEDVFLLCWVGVNSALLYSYPLLAQEARAVLGLQIPLATLAARSIFGTILPGIGLGGDGAVEEGRRAAAVLVVGLLVIFTFPSTFYNIYERVWRLKHFPATFSLTRDEYEGLEFIRDHQEGGAVLSGEWIGNYVPRLTRRHAWLGQYDIPSYEYRLREVMRFFGRDASASERYDFLTRNGISFIYYGAEEKRLGRFEPAEASYLKLAFQKGDVSVFLVE
ncbi:MAG: hypothetical protein Kow0099_28870 [Candidatus Abyssubacteria bacterium]